MESVRRDLAPSIGGDGSINRDGGGPPNGGAGDNAPRNRTRACLSAGLSPIEKRRSYEATTSSRVAAEPLWK